MILLDDLSLIMSLYWLTSLWWKSYFCYLSLYVLRNIISVKDSVKNKLVMINYSSYHYLHILHNSSSVPWDKNM